MPTLHSCGVFMALFGGLVLGGCRPGSGDSETATGGETGTGTTAGETETPSPLPPEEIGPREGAWEVVVDALPFPLADIRTLTVGRKELDRNFANRGLVEVLFDHDEETITIETRKYVFGDAVEAEALERLSLWAFVFSAKPVPRPPKAEDCTDGAWKDNCAIYAYYDGQSQPLRTGMDFRVHLPRGYRGELFVTTEDNTSEDSWPRRSDVTVLDLCSGGELDLQAGRAKVRMCRDLSPAPACPPESVAACAGFPDGSGREAWAPECPCGIDNFGQLVIRAAEPWAADITLDVPLDVWLNATLQNVAPMKQPQCLPQLGGCEAPRCILDDTDPFSPTAEFNYPSDAAPHGAGFNFFAVSGGCTLIPFADPGAPWSPGQTPQEELRGKVQLCSGCL
ncbi:hypothetical protein OV203_18175 [Nannocystis sp. ILAH1]|uniref:hypothetical protein n=1 Tax=unclassified Nannocystis TaxID=2627009 RepID=UPI002270BE15|nr:MULTISPECIES: hypothetical protein [unclassified Nannocystis]MCY0989069.1 hypothetical protein [Nannocystis sp. ILAH1]MCY1067996.1 hypothetical protein [Nannocystis sp. RBIL2]